MNPEVSDDEILEIHWQICKSLTDKLNVVQKPTDVTIVMEMVSKRIVESGNSLEILRRHSPHAGWLFDGASILRSIYDVMLQGLYVMADPVKQDERAQLYLDFMPVETMKRIELMDKGETDLAKRVRSSPRRATSEPKIQQKYDAVKPRFKNKKGKLRNTWYPGTLRELARESKLEEEYELMQKYLSGVVHSSPLTLQKGRFVQNDFQLMDWHWRFTFRILGAYADYKEIALSELEKGLIVDAQKNVFNL